MTLLQRLQSALSKVNGNTLTMEDDRGYDEYYCSKGNHRVFEDQYNHKHQCCYQCFYKEES